ncbi:MAG TPA: hypothetical protein VJH22_02760 [Candidatus Nanoarchaeia archaeon]|nr:hypothetical protein [Candidatus Nanoarchaeia archaeon]
MSDQRLRQRQREALLYGYQDRGLAFIVEQLRSGDSEGARRTLVEIIEQGLCPLSVKYFGQLFPGQILVGEGTDEQGSYWELYHVPLTIPPQAPSVYTVRLKKDRLGTSKQNPQGDLSRQEQWVAQVQKGTYGPYNPGCAPLHSGVAVALLQNQQHPVQSQRTRIAEVRNFLLSHYPSDWFSTMTRIAPYAAQSEEDTVVHDLHLALPSIIKADIKGSHGYLQEEGFDNFNAPVLGQSNRQVLHNAYNHVTGFPLHAWRYDDEPTTPSKERAVVLGRGVNGGRLIYADDFYGRALGWSYRAQHLSSGNQGNL